MRPIDDVGLVSASKILQGNGKVVIRSTFRGLADAKISDPVQAKSRDEWDVKLKADLVMVYLRRT